MKLPTKITITPDVFPWELWQFAKNAEFIAALKQYPGTRWVPEKGAWRVPVDISPRIRRSETFAECRFDDSAQLRTLFNPSEQAPLHDYQKAGACRLYWQNGGILNLAPGLGKTATTIEALKSMTYVDPLETIRDLRVLIVCPAVVRRTWVKELALWWPDHPPVRLVESTASFGVDRITITSYQLMHKFSATAFDAIVFDELHYLKDNRAKRTKIAHELRQSNPKAATFGLTGTIIPNAAKDLWSQIEAVHPGVWGTFWKFVYRYCIVNEDGDYKEIGGLNPEHEEELRERLDNLVYTVTRAEVAHLLPPYSFSTRYIAAKRALKIEDLDAFLGATVPQKVTATAEIVEEFRGNGRQHIAVLTVRHQTAHDLAQKLKQLGYAHVETVTGEMDQAKRYEVLERQAAQPSSISVCSMGSIGTGLNALTFVETAIFAELPWSPGALTQVIRRFNRLSSKHAAEIVFVAIENSRDEQIVTTVIDKFLQVEILQPDVEQPLVSRAEMTEEDFLAALDKVLV